MVQRDYILKEIEKIAAVISAFSQKVFGGKGNSVIVPEKQIESVKEMLLNEMNFNLDKFLVLNREELDEYISGFPGFSVENMELFANCLSQTGFDEHCDCSKKYLEKALRLYELCNAKSKTYSFEREENIRKLKNVL
jgi:hypothetical protein